MKRSTKGYNPLKRIIPLLSNIDRALKRRRIRRWLVPSRSSFLNLKRYDDAWKYLERGMRNTTVSSKITFYFH